MELRAQLILLILSLGVLLGLISFVNLRLLLKKGIDLMAYVRKKVGNGKDSLFWEDNWLNEKVLKHQFPRLFVLESSKQITVSDKLKSELLAASYRSVPRGGIEEEQQQLLQSHIEGTSLSSYVRSLGLVI